MAQVMPHASIILDSGGHAPRYPGFAVTDYWSAGFAENCTAKAQTLAGPHVEDPLLLGYFLDNELAWEPNWATSLTLLQNYMDFPPDAPGRAVAVEFLQDHAASVVEFNAAWGTDLADLDEAEGLSSAQLAPATEDADRLSKEFAVLAFTQYASTAVAALRTVDPNHLVLGCRFHTYHWDELVVEAGNCFDVISQAHYWDVPPVEDVDRVSALVDRPFLLEEFSFKAEDSGYWNVMNYAPVVKTQKDRALAYDAYVQAWMGRPYAVAFHWYKWFDNPTRPDNILAGDNFGLLTPADDPYEPLVTFAAGVNRRVEFWHALSAGR
jgi:agarase